MSTNINAFIEYKPIIEYVPFCQVFLSQDYILFAIMANVRYEAKILQDIEPVSKPKGFPIDLSDRVREYFDENYGICSSYLGVSELETVHQKYLSIPSIEDEPTDVAPTDYGELLAIINMMEKLDEFSKSPSRLVFWFSG
jgi:hypothetical protein